MVRTLMPLLLGKLADGEEIAARDVAALLVLDGKPDAALDLLDFGKRVAQGAELLDQLPFLDGRLGEQVPAAGERSKKLVLRPLFQLSRGEPQALEELFTGQLHDSPFRRL